jgi:beta-lactamase class A
MRQRDTSFLLRWVSLTFIAAALVLTMIELSAYSRTRSSYPPGMTIAGVPVSGVDPEIAAQRILQIYTAPVEIQYAGAIIHLDPQVAGFSVDVESMIAAADLKRTGSGFWLGFWNFLWNSQLQGEDIPLRSSLSEERLRAYLKDEIASRYDQPATTAQPVPGQTTFIAGTPGQELDINRAIILIEDALKSPTSRTVSLTFNRTQAGRPSLQTLQIQIQQIVDTDGFDGVFGFYLLDLQTGQELHFGSDAGEPVQVNENDIAFTASSTIKIPILVSVYKNLGPQIDQDTATLVLEMITKSENPASDALMEKIDEVRGPLAVTEDMKTLGLDNTFLGGYFYQGAPLLQRYETPANKRTDVFTDPDVFNQTTPSEMGSLLADLYQCSESGGGALVAAFPDTINQKACQEMIDYLKRDRIGVLIEAGLPEETQIAHKHGWITDPATGIIQNISDAAIVFTPGGDYVLVIYTYHPVQALWEKVSTMIAKISQAVYNYYNLPTQ